MWWCYCIGHEDDGTIFIAIAYYFNNYEEASDNEKESMHCVGNAVPNQPVSTPIGGSERNQGDHRRVSDLRTEALEAVWNFQTSKILVRANVVA